MAAETGIYITWVTGAILISIAMIPIFKPPYAKMSLEGFIDMFRRYWAHMIVVFSVYLWKDILDGLDRVLMANTQLDMTFLVYAIEGEIVLWIQEGMRSEFLDVALTHFYVMGFMTATFASFIYPIYFDDRHMADRVSLSMFWVYVLAIPFYLFLNVRVTGNYIEGMETIAYDLTPEIHNWFSRIDPFTNGMPSLHIGLPFAIWLCMHKWDEDGRWEKFRLFLIAFMTLTSFAIIYLGIHWIVDIIGGMVIAIMAVYVTERTHGPVWRIADERLFSRRLARALEEPVVAFSRTMNSLASSLEPLKEPGKNQTEALIMTLLVMTGSVLLWDATHQGISIDEAHSPTTASGSGEWLVWVEQTEEEGVSITSRNLTSQSNRTVGGQSWVEPPSVIASGNSFVLFGDNRIDYFEHNQDSGILHPLSREQTSQNITDVAIMTDSVGQAHLAVKSGNELLLMQALADEIAESSMIPNTSVIASNGPRMAVSGNNTDGPLVNITSLESNLTISITLDMRAGDRVEQSLFDSGLVLDFQNSTVVDIVMDSHWLVATVDLGPLSRTILVDTLSFNQTLLSNPRWDSSSPSISSGRVAFLEVTGDESWNPNDDSPSNNDVVLYELASEKIIRITSDEDVDQSDPQILENGVAWIEKMDDGDSVVKWYPFEAAIEPYSSLLLQASVLALLPLLFLWAHQSSRID
ncbi:MAG TPA: phosphatase PAP2 family protein [Candidatus Thalassarchaeaceae archaeon]|nr:phosphatase PAP2 family protein [Candidatus Thalassarchaeaceae archaeon]